MSSGTHKAVQISICSLILNHEYRILPTVDFSAGLIQGLSTGFFLYITFVEMICDEIRDGKDLLLKVWFDSNLCYSFFFGDKHIKFHIYGIK